MVMYSPSYANLMAPGLFEVITTEYKQYAPEYTQYCKVKSTTKQYERGLTMEGFGAAVQKNEGTALTPSDLTEGYRTTFTPVTFGLAARISFEAYDDDLYDVFKGKLGTYFARAMMQRKELLGASLLNNGFATAGADGVTLFSTVHPFVSGGTWSNRLAVDADLSHQSLQDLLTVMETTQEANSINIQLIPKLLIVHPNDRWTASVILESQKKSGTANNDKNALLDLNLKYMVCHYLSDTDAFFLQADQHNLRYFERMKPKFEYDDDFLSKDALFTMVMRATTGYDDARGMAGSVGA